MSTLLVDAETFSEVNVTEVGSYEYARHPSTRVLLWSIRDPDWARSLVFEEPNIWKLLKQLKDTKQIQWTKNEPLDLIHWSAFDRHIVELSDDEEWDRDPSAGAIAGPNNTFWCDLQDFSLIYGGPMKLKHAAAFFGSEEMKDEGKHLIARFCSPQANGKVITKEDDIVRWEQFRAYAAQDTNVMVSMLARFQHLAANGGEDFAKHWPYISMIRRMNNRGAPIDRKSARIAQDHLDLLGQRMKASCKKIYGFTAGQVPKVREYLGTKDCLKETLEEYIDAGEGRSSQLELAKIRLVTSGAAAKKLVPMLRRSKTDGRVRDCFVYHGASTRRLTSMQPQLHNMLRHSSDEAFFAGLTDLKSGEKDLFAEIRLNIRGFIQAGSSRMLVAADLSQIELRTGAGLAGEEWLIDVFATNSDPYLIMASEIYGEDITEKSDPRRQFGKIVELACLYGLGRFGLMEAAAKEGVIITEAYAQSVIDTYRRTHASIVRCWADCASAFKNCIANAPGYSEEVGALTFERIESAVKLVRPSGFAQYYWLPRVENINHWDNCDGRIPAKRGGGKCHGCKEEIAFIGRNKGGVMSRKTTYGGDTFQSGTQGTAADIIQDGMIRCEDAGYPPIMSIHDEVVCEILKTMKKPNKRSHIDVVCELLCTLPEWAQGLPIEAEGWMQRRFTK